MGKVLAECVTCRAKDKGRVTEVEPQPCHRFQPNHTTQPHLTVITRSRPRQHPASLSILIAIQATKPVTAHTLDLLCPQSLNSLIIQVGLLGSVAGACRCPKRRWVGFSFDAMR